MGLDIFQGVRNHLSNSDFGTFLDMVNKIKGPVNCGKFKDCGKCTDVHNAGLCGWFKSAASHSAFGGYMSKGTCKFVDRTNSAEQNKGEVKATTCSNRCNARFRGNGGNGGNSGHGGGGRPHGNGSNGRPRDGGRGNNNNGGNGPHQWEGR